MNSKGPYKAMGELDLLFNYIETYLASKRHRNWATVWRTADPKLTVNLTAIDPCPFIECNIVFTGMQIFLLALKQIFSFFLDFFFCPEDKFLF